MNRVTPDNITELKENEIFVFGSNGEGLHVGGAAKLAYEKFGAIMSQSVGLQGKSFAINTMDNIETVQIGIERLIRCAKRYSDRSFLVTQIGCGIAGFLPYEIAPLFKEASIIENIYLPQTFINYLNA